VAFDGYNREKTQEAAMAHIISITDFDTPELDVYARLTENQLVNRADPANALFIAESPLVIGRALESGCVPVSFLMEPRHLASQALPLLERCPEDIPVYTAAPEVLTRLTGFHLTRGMLCAMRRPALPTVEEVCANARRIAVLENVMNPTNIGAIFRCAAALGMDAVLLTAAGSDPLYRRASRVSMGNVFLIPWTYLPEVEPWPELLRRLGFQTVAMALREDSLLLNDPRLMAAEKLAVVLGTEGDGLSDGTIAACDYTVRIPMTHGVDSLNVAAASAVAFYQLGLMSGGAPT
jgi:tRNA G18 (ribose-2'-O)-methylase SpoU